MKRISILLALMLCMMLTFGAQAAEVAPGDTVTIPISIGASDASVIRVKVNYDSSVFEYVSITCPGGNANNGIMSLYNIFGSIPGGQIGTVTFRIKDNVKSGTYSVGASVLEAWDLDLNAVSVAASGGSVTVVATCAHEQTEYNVIKAADCENDGTQQKICSDCGEVLATETIEKLGHDYGEYYLTKAAACTEKGEETATCANCNEKKTREIDALGHSFGAYEETKKATCTEEGVKTAKCVRCNEAKTEKIDALGHKYGEWTETKKATCTEKGEKASKCVRCDEAKTEMIDALGHNFGAYTVTENATCTEKGEETAKCTRCEATDTREIKALGHSFGAYTVTKNATCTEKGEETAKCTRCDATDTREIKALGHDLGDFVVTKKATCTEKGEEISECSRCDVKETREIKALGHDFGAYTVTKKATCTEKGEEISECSRCDAKETREIKALGHSFGKWTVEVEATCTTAGLEVRECIRKDAREERAIAALGHNAVWKTIKPASGKEEGLKQKVCKRCNAVLEEQIIPVLTVSTKTACTAGIKATDLTGLFDKNDAWKMVTPIDLTKEGTTRYPLIAGNVYEIGYVEVTIQNGVMTAELVVEAKGTAMYNSAMILLSDAREIRRFSANDYEHYEFPVSVNVADLEADEMLMMVTCRLTIDENRADLKYYNFKSEAHKALIESLEAILAE